MAERIGAGHASERQQIPKGSDYHNNPHDECEWEVQFPLGRPHHHHHRHCHSYHLYAASDSLCCLAQMIGFAQKGNVA